MCIWENGMGALTIGQVIIQVSEQLTKEFNKKAKKSFPNEAFAYLMGHIESEKIIVDDLFYPADVDSFCIPGQVNVQQKWMTEAKRRAKSTNTIILGDIHSHSYNNKQVKMYNADTSPSEQDWNSLVDGHIMAICLITELKDGRLRARTKFWGPMPQVKLKTTK